MCRLNHTNKYEKIQIRYPVTSHHHHYILWELVFTKVTDLGIRHLAVRFLDGRPKFFRDINLGVRQPLSRVRLVQANGHHELFGQRRHSAAIETERERFSGVRVQRFARLRGSSDRFKERLLAGAQELDADCYFALLFERRRDENDFLNQK